MATAAAISRLTGHLAGRQAHGRGVSCRGRGRVKAWCRGWGGAVRPGTRRNMARLNLLLAQARRVRGPPCVVPVLLRHGLEIVDPHSVGSQLRPVFAGRVGLAVEVCPLRVDGLDNFQRFLRRSRRGLMSPSHRPPVQDPGSATHPPPLGPPHLHQASHANFRRAMAHLGLIES